MNLLEYKQCLDNLDTEELYKLKQLIESYTNIIILGNGGSNAIASHISQDYTKMLGKKAICFSDPSRLSCYANDYGWNKAYTRFIEHLAQENTLVILISSSGESDNILNAAEYCTNNQIKLVTLSGFSKFNKLKIIYGPLSTLHFWVDSRDYGIVECMHQVILHSVI